MKKYDHLRVLSKISTIKFVTITLISTLLRLYGIGYLSVQYLKKKDAWYIL